MKTISLDHPVRISFKDGECYHDSATILVANGFPSFVRGRGPDVIYPWENIQHIIRVADEAQRDWRIESDLTDERNEDKQNSMRLKADLASVTEQRDLLKRQLEELRSEMQGDDGLNQTKRQRFICGRWVDVRSQNEVAAAEPNPDNRDSYRSTALRAGAKDCALYIGPNPNDLTFVVEMREGAKVSDVVNALWHEHTLEPRAYRIREVLTPSPGDGKPSSTPNG